jgi:hypothetical protein
MIKILREFITKIDWLIKGWLKNTINGVIQCF